MISETENVEIKKVNMEGVPEQLVFGLDIGTRSIVGTVGYRDTKGFTVVAPVSYTHLLQMDRNVGKNFRSIMQAEI